MDGRFWAVIGYSVMGSIFFLGAMVYHVKHDDGLLSGHRLDDGDFGLAVIVSVLLGTIWPALVLVGFVPITGRVIYMAIKYADDWYVRRKRNLAYRENLDYNTARDWEP